MDKEMDNVKAGLVEEIAYHLEQIDLLSNGSEEQEKMVSDLAKLVDALNKINQTEYNALDQLERRNLDKWKNEMLYELEQEKNRLRWDRVSFELSKILVPALISVFSYKYFQGRVLDFEENGRITSTAGRELHLPKFISSLLRW